MPPKYEDIIDENTRRQQQALQQGVDNYVNAQQAADAAYVQGQQDLINQQEQANADARTAVPGAYDNAYGEGGDFYKIAQDRKAAYEEAQRENARRLRTDYNTAKWTGITEAAANLVNLIGVGAMGASNQQYHQYSQDWMRKADQDARERRNRIDRIREQQDALRAQIAGGRLQGSLALANLDRDGVAALIKARGDLNNAQYKSALERAGIVYKNEAEQAAVGAAGDKAKLNVMLDQDKMAFQARENAKNRAAAAARTAARSGSGSGGGLRFDATIDGRPVTLNISKDSLNYALQYGGGDLKKDVAAMAGAGSWADLKKAMAGKTKKNKPDAKGDKIREWAANNPDIISALESGGEGSEDIIASFIQNNGKDLSHFNTHLMRVSNSARAWDREEDEGDEVSADDFINSL